MQGNRSPKELRIPDYVKEDYLKEGNYVEVTDLEKAIPELDVLYMTRIQAERFESRDEYERLKDSYILNHAKLDFAKSDLSIMHPLPRVNEIDVDVDEDSRAHYFDQAMYGRYIRMALVLMLLETKGVDDRRGFGVEIAGKTCENPHCISNSERGIKKLFNENGKCIYCDQ